MKPLQWLGVALGAGLLLYFVYSHLQYFHDVNFLAAILLLEVIVVSVWKFSERYLVVLISAFLWAGMDIPLKEAWTGGRWVVLGVGAVAGFVVWLKESRSHFKFLHLVALFCVLAAGVSASVSQYTEMASLKALSLLLLLMYCSSGARLAVLGREPRFLHGLLWACEVAVYASAVCYYVVGKAIWGNPNSMGAAMSVGIYPVLLWGWMNSDTPTQKTRRLLALLVCVWLIFSSVARAGIVSMVAVTLVFFLCLRQYRLLAKVTAMALGLIAFVGMLAPATLNRSSGKFTDSFLYKGHREQGVLGSRLTPWQSSIASIKEHPWFGTGYGTSPTGEDPGLYFGRFASSSETVRESGSSYVNVAEWVGLLGVLPFAGLVIVSLANAWRVFAYMLRTSDPKNFSIPLAMVVFAGLLHANFEDWLFAVGYYLCVYYWILAFALADIVPAPSVVPVASLPVRSPSSPPVLGRAVPSR